LIDSLLKILAISTDSGIILPDHNKLASAHIYAWKNGLKTGSYYII
jgi:ribonucleotide reductase alpha subunit